MRWIFSLGLFFISCQMGICVDRYWIGGSGMWNDPNNWSPFSGGATCNCVPDSDDHVIIDNAAGTAKCSIVDFVATVESVEVRAGAQLAIGDFTTKHGVLVIEDPQHDGGVGLLAEGSIDVIDSLFILDAGQEGINVKQGGNLALASEAFISIKQDNQNLGSGIRINGTVDVSSGAIIRIQNSTNNGLFCLQGCLCKNQGTIEIRDLIGLSHGIRLSGSGSSLINQNTGTIKILNGSNTGITGTSFEKFDNHGQIEIENIGNEGIRSRGVANNYGVIEIHNTGRGFRNEGVLHNHANGVLKIQNSNNSTANAIHNIDSLLNDGFILIDSSKNLGLFNDNAYCQNNDSIQISRCRFGGLKNADTSEFYNSGCIRIDSALASGHVALELLSASTFNNSNTGIISLHSPTGSAGIRIKGSADLVNQGQVEHHFTNSDYILEVDNGTLSIDIGSVFILGKDP